MKKTVCILNLLLISLIVFTVLPGCERKVSGKEWAIRILLEKVILPDELDHPVIAFTLDGPLPAGTEVAAYAPSPLPDDVDKLPHLVPDKLISPSWFFWVDDNPIADFSHPTRYVFIDAATGQVRVTDQGWWPYINGQPVKSWTDDAERWKPANRAYTNIPTSELPVKTGSGASSLHLQPAAMLNTLLGSLERSTAPQPAFAAGKEFMIMVNGWYTGQTNETSHAANIQNADKFCASAGISRSNVTSGGLASIRAAIWGARSAGADDIILFFTGHGGVTTDNSSQFFDFKGDVIRDFQMASLLQEFCPYPVSFKVIVNCCYSGGFAKELMETCKVDVFLSSCQADQKSYGDYDPGNDPNPSDTGSEYPSGLFEGLEEIVKSQSLQQRAQQAVAGRDFPTIVGWLLVANTIAEERDATSLRLNPGRSWATISLARLKPRNCLTPEKCSSTMPPPEEKPLTMPAITLDPSCQQQGDGYAIYIDCRVQVKSDDDQDKNKDVRIDIDGGKWWKVWGPIAPSSTSANDFNVTFAAMNVPGGFHTIDFRVTNVAGKTFKAAATVACPYKLTVTALPGGEVILSSPRGEFKVSPGFTRTGPVVPDTDVRLYAAAIPGYKFDKWTGDATGTANPTSIKVNGDKAVTAYFVGITATDQPPQPEPSIPQMTGAPTISPASIKQGNPVTVTVPVTANTRRVAIRMYRPDDSLSVLTFKDGTPGQTTYVIQTPFIIGNNEKHWLQVYVVGANERVYSLYTRNVTKSATNYTVNSTDSAAHTSESVTNIPIQWLTVTE
jgi:hypothetical protein